MLGPLLKTILLLLLLWGDILRRRGVPLTAETTNNIIELSRQHGETLTT
jgi:hypothetical protein